MLEFELPNMTCGHCAGMVSQTLKMMDPDCKIEVDMAHRKVSVQSSEDRKALAEALSEAGYPPA